MTELRSGSKITRKTVSIVQRKPLVVTLYAAYLEIRRAGTRTAFAATYDRIYIDAARREADRLCEEKRARKSNPRNIKNS